MVEDEFVVVRNASSKKQVHKAVEYEKQVVRNRKSALRQVLQDETGRQMIWDLLGDCGVFLQSFHADNAYQTAFNEGARSIGNMLVIAINDIDPNLYMLMTIEAKKRQETLKPKRRRRKKDVRGKPGSK